MRPSRSRGMCPTRSGGISAGTRAFAEPLLARALAADRAASSAKNAPRHRQRTTLPSLDGHVDAQSMGPGALFELRELQPGDLVKVSGGGKTVDYRVAALREYDKADLPAPSLFARAGNGRLVLITCGGPFDAVTHHYRDNVVVYAIPVATGVDFSSSGTSELTNP